MHKVVDYLNTIQFNSWKWVNCFRFRYHFRIMQRLLSAQPLLGLQNVLIQNVSGSDMPILLACFAAHTSMLFLTNRCWLQHKRKPGPALQEVDTKFPTPILQLNMYTYTAVWVFACPICRFAISIEVANYICIASMSKIRALVRRYMALARAC